jgi:TonB family protein
LNSTLQLEEPVRVHDDTPQLLVEWTPRWPEFVGAIKPAFARSEARLAGEAPFGLIPLRIMVPSYVVEAFLILAAIFVQAKVAELRPYSVPRISSHDVIYYSGDELPRTQDLGGAEAGTTGRAGGQEAHHRTQTIKIARGGSLISTVVDAPNLKLPSSREAVANLLAIKPNPGPPPAEGLRSTRSAPNMATTVVAPAPNVIRDYTRNGVQLDAVIAPAPSVTRDRPLVAPNLNATLIPPAPSVSHDHTLVAPLLAPAVIPPAPNVSRDRRTATPSLDASVVAPAPSIGRDQARSSPALVANVIPPAPGAVSRDVSTTSVQMMNAAVVPPPVSAPERATSRNAKLSLPAPSVVAPPPSSDVSPDVRRIAGGNMADSSRTVVPPPPAATASGSFMGSLIGKIFGATEVVPPPPTVNSKASSSGTAPSLASNVVPPPPASGTATNGSPTGNRNGVGASLGANVVAPPPSVGMAGGTGSPSRASSAPTLGPSNIVPPPPSLSGAGGGSGNTAGGTGSPNGTLLANNVVPPPPSVGGGSGATGSGLGRKGAGLGAPLNTSSAAAPPTNGGNVANAGAVMSSQPGPKVGIPTSGGTGSLAMSPSGGDKPGLSGAGGGTGIGHGNGPGSGMNGSGTGAAKNGPGRGSDPNARGGISAANGPGGAGNVPAGTPPVRGVDISGGSGIVTLPGFGSDPSATAPATPGRSSTSRQHQQLGVTVVATATSGGAFEPYKNLLKGEKYTTYFETPLGTVVMEFADEATTTHSFGGTLTAPNPIRAELAEGLPRARMVITCTLDASGNLKNVRVLEAGPAGLTAKVLAALRSWKFEPAMRNNQPVEVTAILGFGIDTNDRF